MIKAILFDMDGVLIEAKDWHYEALNRALSLFGMEIDRDAHLATFDGLPTRKKLEILSKSRGLPVRLHGFINAMKQAHTLELAYGRCRPVFHHQLALRRLKEQGYRIAVCSNSIRRSIETMMDLSGLQPFIDLITSNEDVSQPKPDPEMYQSSMKKLGVEPSEALIIEDNDFGIRAAQASGGHVLVVGSTNDVTYDRIRAAIADAQARQTGAGALARA